MGKGHRLVIVTTAAAILAVVSVGFAVAQGSRGARPGGEEIHVVGGPGGGLEFFDFAHDGLTLGDRLTVVGPLLNEDQTRRVGTGYLDCWLGARVLKEGNPYVCTHILHFADGDITTKGLDPHGASDVFFAVTGGTDAYEGASGQAEYIDGDTQTDIIIRLDE
jgi:hypothetical protein